MNQTLRQRSALKRGFVFLALSTLTAITLHAQVKYDEGSRFINGVQLLQDKDNPNAYYYIPRYPKLATNDDGTFELLCMKYVGNKGEPSGGLFHALLEFSLPQ